MTAPAPASGKRSLLLVDAGTVVGPLVRRTLEAAGWEVTTANTRETALAALAARSYDRLFINCYPPVIQGLRVLAGRPDTPNAATPACVLAGPAAAEVAEARRLGAAWVHEFSDFKTSAELLRAVVESGGVR